MTRMMKTIGAALLASSMIASPALAADQEVRQLKAKDNADLASGKAYIVYETVEGKYDIFFLRSMTEEELVRFAENRAAALEERRAELRERRDGAPGISDEELLPDAAFSYVDPDIRNLVRLDSGRVFEKAGKARTYVVEVPPGEYAIFGAGIDGFTGGTCMCMGSVSFDAKEAQITDLGAVLVAFEDGESGIPELMRYEAPEYIRRKTATYIMSVRPPQAGDSVPAKFADMPVVAANYRASPKMPNFLGMIVNRMPPIEGVLRYELDTVIDVQAEIAAKEAAEAEARAKAEAEAAALAEAKAKAEAEAAAAAAESAGDDDAEDEPASGTD